MNRRSSATTQSALDERWARLPPGLRAVAPARPAFELARDPLMRAQLDAMKQTEAERREAQSPGSQMVKLHKPLPALKPKDHQSVDRSQFNWQWFQEQRRAALAQIENAPRPYDSRSEPAASQGPALLP
ncbi:MAG: hypothetical protein AAF515_16805 [Pseudomonadota bacterium]